MTGSVWFDTGLFLSPPFFDCHESLVYTPCAKEQHRPCKTVPEFFARSVISNGSGSNSQGSVFNSNGSLSWSHGSWSNSHGSGSYSHGSGSNSHCSGSNSHGSGSPTLLWVLLTRLWD